MMDGDPKTSGVGFGLMMHESKLDQPLRWKRPRRVFVNSMSDLWHPDVTDEFLDKIFAVMALSPQHTFQVLTKRPDRMADYMLWDNNGDSYDFENRYSRVLDAVDEMIGRPNMFLDAGKPLSKWLEEHRHERAFSWPLPNVWLGTSVENARWRTRIDDLRDTPAAVRFLSCEPLLGPLIGENVRVPGRTSGEWLGAQLDLTDIDWVIIGGESGPGARPMDPEWVRAIVRESRRQGAAPFVKQLGRVWASEHLGNVGHGGDIETFPPDLQVREWPKVASLV
jgi:protein gp37